MMGQFGDEEIVKEIYDEYVASLSQKLAESETALEAADWIKLDRAAHAMKGNALAAGDNEVADTAITLRNAAKLQDGEQAVGLVAKIRELHGKL